MKVKLSVSASSVRESGLREVRKMFLSFKENENGQSKNIKPAGVAIDQSCHSTLALELSKAKLYMRRVQPYGCATKWKPCRRRRLII